MENARQRQSASEGGVTSSCRTGVHEAYGLECARLTDWSARGSRTGVREAYGLECARLTDWSARGSRTGVLWSIVSCRGGRSPLRRWASSPVRGFDFPCTRFWVPCTGKHAALHGVCILPTRGYCSPYTEGLIFLHGGFGFPTRRKGSLMWRTLWYNLMRGKTENADENGRNLK